MKGTLGRRRVGICRSTPKDELRLCEIVSKFPDLLPRSVAVNANPESGRDEIDPKKDRGEFGDGGVLPFVVVLVTGRSRLDCRVLACKNTLNIGDLDSDALDAAAPNSLDGNATSFARHVGI